MEAKATARTVLIAPRKARLVVNLVRGKDVSDAMAILNNLNKKSARLTKKVLVSAVANAENNFKMDKNNLYVKEAYINDGPIMKRRRIGSRSHIDGMRVGIIKDWQAKWYSNNKDFSKYLGNDLKIRKYLDKRLKDASVSNINIQRDNKKTEIVIYTAKPGVVIGHGGEEIEKLKKELCKLTGENIVVSIFEIKNPDMVAQLVANNVAKQIENRGSYRMAQKRAIRNTMKAGAKGIKILASGRLNGVDIARSEVYSEGTVPLHTLRADIDYATAEADTTFGKIGIKVWIYKGEVLPKKNVKGGSRHATNAKKN